MRAIGYIRRAATTVSYVMKVSGNGQVSVPAEVRARWGAEPDGGRRHEGLLRDAAAA